MDHWKHLIEVIPFILQTKEGVPKINKARIIESLVTAAIIVGVTYGMLKADFDNMKNSIIEIKADIRLINQTLFGRK